MPLHRPRRIFRADPRRPASIIGGRTVLAGLVGSALGGAAVLLVVSTDLFGSVPDAPGLVSAGPAQVAVVDGETLRVRDVVVRLAGVTAPPRGQACGQGMSFDCGAASSEALTILIRDHGVACRVQRRDSAGIAWADCDAAGVDLNRAQITAGWARARPDAPALQAEEALARTARRGIWRAGGTPTF